MRVDCQVDNRTGTSWKAQDGFSIGWQIYDPDTGIFISEGEWLPLERDVPPGSSANVSIDLQLPPENGQYRIYVSPLDPKKGWLYTQGEPLVVIDTEVRNGAIQVLSNRSTTLRRLRWHNFFPALVKGFRQPFQEIGKNRRLIRSMVRREILARYRGSFGDVAWTILHPLLLMATYFFVFGVVLPSRFGSDASRSGWALYFLAGMLPWLGFSEPAGRAAYVILEYRNFVKKLVFPVSILPVNQVIAGLVTSLLATALFLLALLVIRGHIPWTAALLPLLLIPQVLFTLGVCWFLAALGVYLRDLAQIMGFLLTLWFFLTPICYPETSLPVELLPLLAKNPLFHFVRAYRQIFLEGVIPATAMLVKLWSVSLVVFFVGHAWFTRLRKTFADVV
ncbi:MAG TPA: ABC transporter permease [Bryobacteraceae bacterium]|nr:ABC transporter permease [Bryobacteraceae bacterium]